MYKQNERPALNGETLEQLLKQSGLKGKEYEKFMDDLEKQLTIDNHDFGVEERLEIVSTCF